ncbi:unnamed protein product [Cuscuta europaea]|uniref:Uncharacterized protein n=1 Tax=Cuscuta europaea TaxID=41803 RepID=A0A9P1E968_CUSEU|nr:unnamed protein product [Cuscuta europaea]
MRTGKGLLPLCRLSHRDLLPHHPVGSGWGALGFGDSTFLDEVDVVASKSFSETLHPKRRRMLMDPEMEADDLSFSRSQRSSSSSSQSDQEPTSALKLSPAGPTTTAAAPEHQFPLFHKHSFSPKTTQTNLVKRVGTEHHITLPSSHINGFNRVLFPITESKPVETRQNPSLVSNNF